jgi:hypothetical protein
VAQSSARLDSVSRWRLNDPRASRIDGNVARGEGAPISLDSVSELVARSEIDFGSLKHNVRDLLARRAQCSVGEVLAVHPARQGLGSVVGYVALGSRHGMHVPARHESIAWHGEDGRERHARIPLMYFLKDKRHELV